MNYTNKEKDTKQLRRKILQDKIHDGEIQTLPKFQPRNWLKDPLISHIRSEIVNDVEVFINTNSILCDPLDLKYQVLFRSTTYKPEELFLNGKELHQYLKSNNVFKKWINILYLDQKRIREFKLDKKKLSTIIEEQYRIIEDRLSESTLPLSELLQPRELFKENGWHIKRTTGLLYASNREYGKAKSVPLEFREVELSYARSVFGDLHYIHTPRADIAIGLFISGEKLPFSVMGATKIDRDYKRDALLIQGYDYENC